MGQVVMLQDEPRGPSILIEVNVTSNGLQRVPFPDIAQLRSTIDQKVIIKSLRLITAEVLTRAVVASNVTAPVAELQKMSITLYSEGWEKGQTIPILILNDMTTQAGTIPHRYGGTYFDNWVNVDWPKSYIQYSNGTVSANSPYTILLDCQYVRLDAQNRIIMGPSK